LTGLGTLQRFGGVEALQNSFWNAFAKFENNVFLKFESSWPEQNVNVLAGPVNELSLYYNIVVEHKWENEKEKIRSHGKAWVHRYFKFLLDENSSITEFNLNDADIDKITPYDWFLIMDSISLLVCHQRFCEEFGRFKTDFSYRLIVASKMISNFGTPICPQCFKDLKSYFTYGTGFACDKCHMMYVDSIPNRCVKCGLFNLPNDLTISPKCCKFLYKVEDVDPMSCLIQNQSGNNKLVPSKSRVYKI
jgi:hypothetical protein